MDHDNNMSGELALDRGSEGETVSSGFNVGRVIDNLAHWLPTQAPLKDFIHHNTLHAFQDRAFHEGLLVASRLYGAKPYLDLETYQQYYEEGRITESALERVLCIKGISLEIRPYGMSFGAPGKLQRRVGPGRFTAAGFRNEGWI